MGLVGRQSATTKRPSSSCLKPTTTPSAFYTLQCKGGKDQVAEPSTVCTWERCQCTRGFLIPIQPSRREGRKQMMMVVGGSSRRGLSSGTDSPPALGVVVKVMTYLLPIAAAAYCVGRSWGDSKSIRTLGMGLRGAGCTSFRSNSGPFKNMAKITHRRKKNRKTVKHIT